MGSFIRPIHAWTGLLTLWAVGFTGALSRFIMAFYQVQISEELGIGRGFISMAWSTNLFISAICAPLGGFLADRYGPKKIIIASTVSSILGAGLVYIGHSPLFFYVGYGIISGFVGISASATYMLLFQLFRRHQAKAATVMSSSSSLGLTICTPLFVLNSWITWESAFLASSMLGLFLILPMITLLLRSPKQMEDSKQEDDEQKVLSDDAPIVHQAGQLRYLSVFVVGFGLFTCGFNMGTVEMNLVAIHQLANVTPAMIALSMSLLGILELAGSFAFGFLLDGMNRRLALALLYGVRVVGFILLFLHINISPVLFAIAFGITYLGAVPGALLVASEWATSRGKQVGYYIFLHQAGGIIGALAGGLVYDYYKSYQILIGLDAFLCLVAGAGYLLIYRRTAAASARRTLSSASS